MLKKNKRKICYISVPVAPPRFDELAAMSECSQCMSTNFDLLTGLQKELMCARCFKAFLPNKHMIGVVTDMVKIQDVWRVLVIHGNLPKGPYLCSTRLPLAAGVQVERIKNIEFDSLVVLGVASTLTWLLILLPAPSS